MMDTLVKPTPEVMRRWLDKMGMTFYECASCQALHLPHMQNFVGIADSKLAFIDDVVLFSARAEVRPSALLALAAHLSEMNASSLTLKAFLDLQDDQLPMLVVCQALPAHAGVTYEQFAWFVRHSEEQISMLILETCAHELLYDDDDNGSHARPAHAPYLH